MNTISNTYYKFALRHVSLDRPDLSDGWSITVVHLLLRQDYLPETCYGDILSSDEDVFSEDPDRLYEPPIVFDQDNENAYK